MRKKDSITDAGLLRDHREHVRCCIFQSAAAENELPDANTGACLMRIVPCVVTEPFSPSNFHVMMLTSEIMNWELEVKKIMQDVYSPLLNDETITDDYLDKKLYELSAAAADGTADAFFESVGNYAVVKTDSGLYRADICKKCDNGGFWVELIDIGKVVLTELSEMLPMIRELYEIPRLSSLCCLSNVGDDTESKIRTFQRCVAQRQGWYILTVSITDGPKHEVYLTTPDKKINVNEDVSDADWDPRRTAFESAEADCSDDDVDVAIHGFRVEDDAKICKLFSKTGSCFKGESCRKLHVKVDPSLLTNLKEPTFFEGEPLPALSMECDYDVTGACINRAGQFFVRVSQDEIDYEEEMGEMWQLMNQPDIIRKYEKLKGLPDACELVLCYFTNKWMRGKVLYVDDNDDDLTAVVLLVDLGGICDRHLNQLRAMPACFAQLPCFARQIRLNAYSVVSGDFLCQFRNIYNKTKPWTLQAISYNDPIEIVDIFDKNGENIAMALEKGGIVRATGVSEPADGVVGLL